MDFFKRNTTLIVIILIMGALLRFHNIGFGLPHSFRADEPELVEPAVLYTFQIRNIIRDNDYYKLIPVSYVYGTFPSYLFTLVFMFSSKLHNLLNIELPKENMYIIIRGLHALLSLGIVGAGAWFYKRVFYNTKGAILALLFLALNWKLIVHGHYANADMIITGLLTFSFISLFKYFKRGKSDTLFTTITAVLFGLALGTKITTLLTLPLFLYIFVVKRDYKNFLAFLLIVMGIFLITNPFSLIFSDNFVFRVMEMATKESGITFDSVNSSPFKYFSALSYITTPLLALLAIVGISKKIGEKIDIPIHIFLVGHIAIYLLFFSLGNRRVDRWLLPILPITILYGTYGLHKLKEPLNRATGVLLTTIVIASVAYFPTVLIGQFKQEVPKTEAYLWMRDNIDPFSTKLVITEEGLDPMNKLKYAKVIQYPLYTSEGAQFFMPPDPQLYDFVVLSSRPMQNFKRVEVKETYPFYTKTLKTFEQTVLDPSKFTLIKSFVLPKPNLIPLSDVFIYESVSFTDNL